MAHWTELMNSFFQHLARLDEAQRQYQTLQSDRETLRLKLDDQEKMIDILRSQMESSSQRTVQHSRTIDSLYQQNRLLSEQLNQHKLEIQQLMVRSLSHKYYNVINIHIQPTLLLTCSSASLSLSCAIFWSDWVRPAQVRPSCCRAGEAAATSLSGWTQSALPGGKAGETAAHNPAGAPAHRVTLPQEWVQLVFHTGSFVVSIHVCLCILLTIIMT